MSPWAVERVRGPAGALHALEAPAGAGRLVRVCEPDGPALVLGSHQPAEDVCAAAAASAGVAVARRRSGGGAVLVAPGEQVWVDVFVPAGDPLAPDDVRSSLVWLGEVWAVALDALGLPAPQVHRGALVGGPAGRRVCFAGLGPGEVCVAGRKVVGISQRRTRRGTRSSCVAVRDWDPTALERLLCAPSLAPAAPPGRGRPDQTVQAVGYGALDPPLDGPALLDAFVAALPGGTDPSR